MFRHTVEEPNFILFRGFDDQFWVPHSRNTTVDRSDVEAVPALKILASSPEAGIYAIKTDKGRQIFIMGHSEYDRDTLKKEYLRDLDAGVDIPGSPKNYFPNDDPTQSSPCHLAILRQSALCQLAELFCLPDRPLRHPGDSSGPPHRRLNAKKTASLRVGVRRLSFFIPPGSTAP